MIRRFFSPPVFDNDEDNFRAKFINGFAWFAILLLGAGTLTYLFRPTVDESALILSVLIGVMILALFLLHRKRILASSLLIIVIGWLGLGIQAVTADGVRDVIIVAYICLGLLASIIVSWQAGGIVIFSSVGAIWVLTILELNGILHPQLQGPVGYAIDLTLIFVAIAVLIILSTTSLRDAIQRANQSEAGLRLSNQNLQELNQNLETRVANRTAELELANQRNEKRAKQFEAIAQVARATVANQSLEELLANMVRLISTQFGFYHAGIFLLDEKREYAELRAANSEGGQRMLSRGHRLAIGQSGIVGYVAATGRARIALDVGDDAAFFNNPDLPSTRSEIALPLRVADQIIGILDVQSITSNAFQEEDVEVLSTLADQVAIGIQNALSYETSQKLLQEAQQTSGSLLRESWKVLGAQREGVIGFHLIDNKVARLTQPLSSNLVDQAVLNKTVVKEDGDNAMLAVPIRMRDEVIGVMDIRVPDEHEWDEDEVDIAEAVAERLSLALESVLLLKSTQRRAEIERITADIASKIGATSQFDSILRTAAEELSRALGGSEVLVQLQSEVLDRVDQI